jgi:hypothetical protein
MHPTLAKIAGIGGAFGVLLCIVVLWSLAIRAQERGADILGVGGASEPDQDRPRSPREVLPRIGIELLALQCLSMVGVSLLMIVFSVSLPALRNPPVPHRRRVCRLPPAVVLG